MSIISHNILATNASNKLNIVINRKQKSIEKLSSGYRINRSADDAAGLSISENMRREIRGLSRGTQNTQDGISLCQVADGALAEVSSMLHRMTELSVQSANGTNTAEDRQAIQLEIEQLKDEINHISNTTTFNDMHIFSAGDSISIKNFDTIELTSTNHDVIEQFNDFKFQVDDDGLMLVNTTKGLDYKKVSWDDFFSTGNFDGFGKLESDATFTYSNPHSKLNTSMSITASKGYTKDEIIDKIVSSNFNIPLKSPEFLFISTKPTDSNVDYSFADNGIPWGYYHCDSYRFLDGDDLLNVYQGSSRKQISIAVPTQQFNQIIIDAYNSGSNIVSIPYRHSSSPNTIYNLKVTLDYAPMSNMRMTPEEYADYVYYYLRCFRPQKYDSFTSSRSVSFDDQRTPSVDNGLWIQSGSSKDSGMYLHINTMNANSLGIGNVDVTSESKAKDSLSKISSALEHLSSIRSEIGAQQNRLEHTVDNNNNVVENLTSSESRIRDTDMADEIVKQAKESLLEQVGQSMLAQANQTPKNILQLLQ